MNKKNRPELVQHFQLILNAVGEGILGTDINGIITFMNPAAEKILGYSHGELIKKPLSILLAPENAASLHLKALARLSRILKDQEFRTHLMEAKNESDLYHIILTEDEKF